MALRTILTDGDPALHKACRPVTNFDQRLHDLLNHRHQLHREMRRRTAAQQDR